MKLLIFSPYYPPHIGGLEMHADEFNKHLSQKGIDITIITPQLPQNTPSFEIIHTNVKVFRFPAFEIIPNYPIPKFWKIIFWEILKRVFAIKFDIVISRTRFFITTCGLAFLYAKVKKTKWIHIEHGSDFVKINNTLYSVIARFYDHTIGRAILTLADDVVANSKASANFCKKLSGRNCHVIYRGVEIEKIKNQLPNTELKKTYKDKIIITYIGRLIAGKGVQDLIQAISSIKNQKIIIFIIGDGPEREKLEKLSRDLIKDNEVVFFGYKSFSETIGLLKISDIFINPSYTEGLPTSVIEAALCEKSILATNVGGTPEIITNNTSGYLIEPRDVSSITIHLQKLINDKNTRETFGKNAFADIQNKFNWDDSVEKYLKLFKELLN